MTTQTVQIFHLEVDAETLEGDYRFLVNGRDVKYISVQGNGILSGDDMCFAPILLPSLPSFPLGDWNVGHIAMNDHGAAAFAWTRREDLPSITDPWHPRQVDILDLNLLKSEKLRSNVWKCHLPSFFGNRSVIAKMANFHWEIGYYNNETKANLWIRDLDIAPEFLGHIIENGRIIGFLVECIDEARRAGHDDVDQCRRLLDKVHQAGIKHGDVNRHNFLVTKKRTWLVDWEHAQQCNETAILEEGANELERYLTDESGKGGTRTMTLEEVAA
ncbi:hypothetical protein FH972_009502 [Carpinus fangiana]|uniref:Aminoglycoside phosphotransferase domain-containing protein n=1 Tax=Carpinus fangiana TaxID=176857 RepID=A0A660KRL5_9ROSI|nr:hypothetical protein FH972_009502 [Carpinus fangiana]